MARSANKRSITAEPAGSLVERCYLQLRSAIANCEIAPGERVTERELMVRQSFGRTPLREALLRLQQEGLVLALPRSGYQVTAVTEKTVNDFFAVWRLLGPLIMRLAYSRMTPDVRERIKDVANLDTSTTKAWVDQSEVLFGILVETAQNDDLVYIMRRLSANMRRIFLLFLSSGRGAGWRAQNMPVGQFALATDPEAVAAMIAEAIAQSHEGVLEVLRQAKAAPDASGQPPATRRPRAARARSSAAG